ncbi:MAG TPA: hypothetical protein PLH26_18845, partial [Agriterribacter sp.]|nr:hypothetical protein [Agriterribacter sp.]
MHRRKKMSIKRVMVATGLLAFATFTQAQQVLTLPDALEYTLKASQAARKAKLEIENGTYRIDEVKSRALPQLNANGTLTDNPILQLTALPGEIVGMPGQTMMVAFGQKWNSGAVVSLS